MNRQQARRPTDSSQLSLTDFPVSVVNLLLDPSSLRLAYGTEAGVLRLHNMDETPVAIRARPFQWSQEFGEDIFTPTRDIFVSPPIQQMEPGQEQLLRFITNSRLNRERERAFRLVIDQFPDEPKLQSPDIVTLRYSVPLFLNGLDSSPARLRFRVNPRPDANELIAENLGGTAAKLKYVTLVHSDGTRSPLMPGLPGFVLPREHRRWVLPDTRPRRTARIKGIKASVNGNPGYFKMDAPH